MIKLLYLMAGITLKQTVDELKSVFVEYLDYLKKRRDAIGTYVPTPALEKGSPEAHRAIVEHRFRATVEPEVARLSKKILCIRCGPLVLYVLGTIGLLVWISILELSPR